MIEIQNVSFEYEKSQGTLSHIVVLSVPDQFLLTYFAFSAPESFFEKSQLFFKTPLTNTS